MSENKTRPTDADVDAFVAAVEPERRRRDSERLLKLFDDLIGWRPRMWGPSIIGYGSYHYVYASGREGEFLATGFAPRKQNLSIYIMPGYADFSDVLADLGKHKLGRSCLYINKLDDVDEIVLGKLILLGLDRLRQLYPVRPE